MSTIMNQEITIINGSILDSEVKYICHQCNCVTTNSKGLASKIFGKWPCANTYSNRLISGVPSVPGSIDIIKVKNHESNLEQFIINMYGQYYPGTSKYPNNQKDGIKSREQYFRHCLIELSKLHNLESVAFPYGIGCSLAGGHWPTYLSMIKEFANNVDAKIFIYKFM